MLRVPAPTAEQQTLWDLTALSRPPATYPAPALAGEAEEGIRPLFFAGEPLDGKPTRVFAWYGAPPGRKAPGPAMVLVHGGGGTAFKYWVKLWVERGFAAIAMDTSGGIPLREGKDGKGSWQRHAFSGPGGWGGFAEIDKPVRDQWAYHAVAAVIRAHSLIRSFPEVDADRIGLTGISWGGYLAEIVAGVDARFAFVAPVYGCGFLGENSAWRGFLLAMGQEKGRHWLMLWDPSRYLGYARMPMLFCAGTNDHFYPLDSWWKTCRLPRGPVALCCKVRMPHAHPPAGDPPEITAFARALLKQGVPLLRIIAASREIQTPWVEWSGRRRLDKAVLNFTRDKGVWENRVWESRPADIDAGRRRVSAELPAGVTAWFFNLIDRDGLVVSSEYVFTPE
jgi:dienelactone hydrolase